MIRGPGEGDEPSAGERAQDPLQVAVFPLAVPYLLNPAGIVALVTLSADAVSVGMFAVVVGNLAVVLLLDVAVFRWAGKVSDRLDESRLLVTEKVFGFLLAALRGSIRPQRVGRRRRHHPDKPLRRGGVRPAHIPAGLDAGHNARDPLALAVAYMVADRPGVA
jgi:hypothetical protein